MLLQDIRTRLADQGVGSTYGSTGDYLITLRSLNSTADNGIAVVPTGGFQNSLVGGWEQPTFQTLVRGTRNSSTDLEDKVDDLISALDGFQGVLNDFVYHDIRKQGDTLWLGPDKEKRPVYSVNWMAVKSTIPECFFFFDASMGISQVYTGTYTRADTATVAIEGGPHLGRILSTAVSGVPRIGWFTTS